MPIPLGVLIVFFVATRKPFSDVSLEQRASNHTGNSIWNSVRLFLRKVETVQSDCRTDPQSGFVCHHCRLRLHCESALPYSRAFRRSPLNLRLQFENGSSRPELESDCLASLVLHHRP